VSRRAGDLKEASERAVEFQYQEDRAGNRGGGDDEANENRGVAFGEQAEAHEDRCGPADEHDQQGRGQCVPAPLGNEDPADLRQRADGCKGPRWNHFWACVSGESARICFSISSTALSMSAPPGSGGPKSSEGRIA
jgi:hypothetical protein